MFEAPSPDGWRTATLLRCAERGCGAVAAPPARGASKTPACVVLSPHVYLVREVLSIFSGLNDSLKYGLPAGAALDFLASARAAGAPPPPFHAFCDALFSQYVIASEDKAALQRLVIA